MIPGRITLIGYRAVGKSTIGRLLARDLDLAFEDADHVLEQHLGKPIPEIFAQHGERTFRDLETTTLMNLLAGTRPLVLATGGGAVLREVNRALLRRSGGTIIYLHAPVEILQERLRRNAGSRPSLTGANVADEVPGILALRDPLYREIATHLVDVTGDQSSTLAAVKAVLG